MDRGLARVLKADFQGRQPERRKPGVAERAWRRLKGHYYESIPLTLENGAKVRLWGWARDGETAHQRIVSISKQNGIICPETFHKEFGDGLGPMMLGGGRVVRDFQFYVDGKLPLIEVDGGFCGLNANNTVLRRGMRLELKEEAPTCGLGNRVANTKGIRVMEWPSLDPSTGFIHNGGAVLKPVEMGAEIVYQPLISINPRGLEPAALPGGNGVMPGAALAQDFASNRLREMVLLKPPEQDCKGAIETIRYYDGIGARATDAAPYMMEMALVGKHATIRHGIVVEAKAPSLPGGFSRDLDGFMRGQEIVLPGVGAGAEAPVQPVLPKEELVLGESGFVSGKGREKLPKSASIQDLPVEREAAGKRLDSQKDASPGKVARKPEEEHRERDGGKTRRKEGNISFWRIDSWGQMKPMFAPRGMHAGLDAGPEMGRRAEKVRELPVVESKKRMVGRIHSKEEFYVERAKKPRAGRKPDVKLDWKTPMPRKEVPASSGIARAKRRNGRAEAVGEGKGKEMGAGVGPKVPARMVKFGKVAPLSSEIVVAKRKGAERTAAIAGEKKEKAREHGKKRNGQMELLGRKKRKGKRRREMEEYLVVSKPAKKRKGRRWLPLSKR